MNQSALNDSFSAQDLAGKAILFEIGAKAGILEFIEDKNEITTPHLSKQLSIDEEFVKSYLETLVNLSLLSRQEIESSVTYSKTPNYQIEKNKIGYITWGMISCAPLISNTSEFVTNFNTAVRHHHRCGEHVARTSKWMGEKDFYPHAENVIIKLKPKKVVDLGSGTCGLLIDLTKKIPGLKGIGVDISKNACDKAKAHLKALQLTDRIEVIVSPIQDLIQNKNVFMDTDVIHAGFVFHDLLPEEEATLDKLLVCINKTAPKAALVIVDAIPFSQNEHEKSFSSAFSFLHKFFMGRKLLSESEWKAKLSQAGYTSITIEQLGISGGRIFVATNNQ